ncbi:hypothetical protein NIES267_28740 [Calothrix parasitica NIES-267]|uniref:Uncharacterized protein n=1 Tax=Calothrix parasitica NIES-267 TaxID=1973488 RepID=A0A1Z4LQ59_9CYAN|nr:hypothetical protein NIES267_28740 [Calothrix parasitica NIES-267]
MCFKPGLYQEAGFFMLLVIRNRKQRLINSISFVTLIYQVGLLSFFYFIENRHKVI